MSDADQPDALPSVGSPEPDGEHADLQARTRALEDAVLRGASDPEVQALADDLLEHALAHFEHEEALLEAAGYPQLEEHRASHDRLLRVLMHLREDLRRHRHPPEVTVRFIRAWDLEHVRKADTLYADYLRDRTVS